MLQVGALIAAVEEGPVLRTDVATLHGFEAHAGFAYLASLLADFLALFLVQRAQKVVEVLPAGRCCRRAGAGLHAGGQSAARSGGRGRRVRPVKLHCAALHPAGCGAGGKIVGIAKQQVQR